jgi:tetratricopeptide (TPR) repeat protein
VAVLGVKVHRYYGLFVGVFLILIVVFLPLLLWHLKGWQHARILIIDQTVTDISYRQHRALVWALNHLKISPTQEKWSTASDYCGFHPERAWGETVPEQLRGISHGWGDSLEQLDFDEYDLIYLTDSYGVHGYLNSRALPLDLESYASAPVESIPAYEKSYGGVSRRTAINLVEYLRKGGAVIGEFNLFGYPTARDPVTLGILENIFGVDYTGWSGRYFHNLGEVNGRFKELYGSRYSQPWNFEGPGLILACEGIRDRHPPDILVFPSEESSVGLVQLISRGDSHLTSRVEKRLAYDSWFDIVRPRFGAEVVSEFRLELRENGLSELHSRNLSPEFPAIVIHTGTYRSVYMAGDFADNPTRNYLASFWGCEGLFRVFNRLGFREAPFFWSFYLPFVENTIGWSLQKPLETIPPQILASEHFLWQDYAALLEEPTPETVAAPELTAPAVKEALVQAKPRPRPEELPFPIDLEPEEPPPVEEPVEVVEAPPEKDAPVDEFELLWRAAREASWAGDYPTAVSRYEEVLARYPAQPLPLLEYARVLSWSRLFQESVEAYEGYLAMRPGDMEASLELARVYSWMGNYENSLRYYNVYLSEADQDGEVLFERAKVYLWNAQYELAIADLEEVLRRNPEHLEARLELAQAYSELGKLPQARENYRRVLNLYPENITALVGMARLSRWQGDYYEARRNIDLTLELDPANGEALTEKKLLSEIFGVNLAPGVIVERGEEYSPDLKRHYLTTGYDEYFLDANRPTIRGLYFTLRYSRARYFEKQKFFNPDFERYNYELLSNRLNIGVTYPLSDRWQIRAGLSVYSFEDGTKDVFYTLPEDREYFVGGDIYVGPPGNKTGVGVGFSQQPYVDKIVTTPPSLSIAAKNTYLLKLQLRSRRLPYLDGVWQHSRYEDNLSNIVEFKATRNFGRNPIYTIAGGVIYRDFDTFSEDYWSPRRFWNPYLYGGIYAIPWGWLVCQLSYSPGYYREYGGESEGYFHGFYVSTESTFTDWLKWYISYLHAENTERYVYRYFTTRVEIKLWK